MKELLQNYYDKWQSYREMESHIPEHLKVTNWIKILFLLSALCIFILFIKTVVAIRLHFKTETIEVIVLEGKILETRIRQHYELVRYTGRSSVPSDAQQVSEYEECDDICTFEDESGLCLASIKDCDTYYDYSVYEWVTKGITDHWYPLDHDRQKLVEIIDDWKILYTIQPKVRVQYKWEESWLSSKYRLKQGTRVKIKIFPYRKQGKQIHKKYYIS